MHVYIYIRLWVTLNLLAEYSLRSWQKEAQKLDLNWSFLSAWPSLLVAVHETFYLP